jgi:hypothetical protein
MRPASTLWGRITGIHVGSGAPHIGLNMNGYLQLPGYEFPGQRSLSSPPGALLPCGDWSQVTASGSCPAEWTWSGHGPVDENVSHKHRARS